MYLKTLITQYYKLITNMSVNMSNINKKFIAIAILPLLLAGCDFDDESASTSDNSGGTSSSGGEISGSVFNLFGVNAVDSGYSALILSATDNYASTVVTDAYVYSSDINAGLINNNGTNDTIDVEVVGVAAGSLMLQADNQSADFSTYESGYLEFKIRSKSAVPEDLTVAIDNGWPNRKVFSLNGHVDYTNAWEEISIPIQCMQPGEGMDDFSLSSVVTPFYMESSSSYSFEITDIAYKEVSEFTPVVDAESCAASGGSLEDPSGEGDESEAGVNNAVALSSSDISIYYTGDDSLATDVSSNFPLGYYGGDVTESGQVLQFSLTGNGGIFLKADDGNEMDFSSFYAAGFMSIDIKVEDYGSSPDLQIKLEDVDSKPNYSNIYSVDSSAVPADGSWYRCNIPVSSLAPSEDYLASTSKAPYLSGLWDSMENLNFSFTNVALISSKNFSDSSDCIKI